MIYDIYDILISMIWLDMSKENQSVILISMIKSVTLNYFKFSFSIFDAYTQIFVELISAKLR